jgi:RTX calcium-binding nonapeptide repeat (4 copies)
VRCTAMFGLRPSLDVELADGDDTALLNGPISATVDGGPGADRVTELGTGYIVAEGGKGNDVLTGGALIDTLSGGGGRDELHGGGAHDFLADGDTEGAVDADVLDGGARSDTADYSSRSRPLHIDLQRGGSGNGERGEGDTLRGIEELQGGSGRDFLAGDNKRNVINDRSGVDRVVGRGGADLIHIGLGLAEGGAGNDHILIDGAGRAICGAGSDHVQAGHEGAGPWVSSTCEVVGEQQDNFTYGVRPYPLRVSRKGRLVFRLPCLAGAFGSCKQRLSLTAARRPYRQLDTARLRRKAGTRRPALQLPARLVRRARHHRIRLRVRLTGDDETNGWSFVWRFDVRLPR